MSVSKALFGMTGNGGSLESCDQMRQSQTGDSWLFRSYLKEKLKKAKLIVVGWKEEVKNC